MLVITNGRVLVDPAMNEKNMGAMITEWIENVSNFYDIPVVFEKVEKPFLMYKIPAELPWKNLIDSKPADTRVEFMAIGKDDEVQLPYNHRKTLRHNFSIEELKEKADHICEDIAEIDKLEKEKKSIVKSYNDKIADINADLTEKAQLHRQGYELRDKTVVVVMNFKEKVKYYNDSITGELLATEPMTEKDQRTLFDIKGYDPDEFENDDISGFEIGFPEESLEDDLNEGQDESVEQKEEQTAVESQADAKGKAVEDVDLETNPSAF